MEDIKTIIEKIYKDYNPDKVSNIPSLLEKYKGKEDEMLFKISEKYSIRLQDYIKIDYLWLVTEILRKHEPVNISSASTLLLNNKNREDELLMTLCNKYNAKLNDIIISIYTSSAPVLNQKDEVPAQKTFILESRIENKVQETKKSNTALIFGISAVVIITVVLILFFSGVFSTNKKENNDNVSNSSFVSNTDNSDSKTTNNNDVNSTNNNVEKIAERPIVITSITASSSMLPSGNLLYTPEKAIDNDLQTWWSPASPHSDGLNSWLKIDFGQIRKVVAIEIHNGSHFLNYPKYGDLYFKNNRLINANLEFSDGTIETINLREVDEIQKISFTVKNTTYIKLVPLGWAKGSTWNDLCISQFIALGE